MESLLAYIDESGSHGFDFTKEGTSTFFVVSAIIISDHSNLVISEAFEIIKSAYFPISELKSSKIGNRDELRIEIIKNLEPLDFKYFYLVVDKRQISLKSGLQYKEVFYKFLYGILYNNLYSTFRNLSIVADQLITNEFINGFKHYVLKNHVVDLFSQSNLEFKSSKAVSLLQLADFIGGTLNRFYSGKSELNLKELLPEKYIGEIYWPQSYKPYTVDNLSSYDEFEYIISDLALLRIENYLGKYSESDEPNIKNRIYFLNYIRSIFLYNSRTRYIFTDEIIRHIQNLNGERVREQYFRQQIVGPLRTEGLLISSNSNGYKIPSSVADIHSFFNLSSRIIHPMLNRLQMTHKALIQATNGKLNILENPEYGYLKEFLDG